MGYVITLTLSRSLAVTFSLHKESEPTDNSCTLASPATQFSRFYWRPRQRSGLTAA